MRGFDDGDEVPREPQRCRVILVHGTWGARGLGAFLFKRIFGRQIWNDWKDLRPLWFEPDSLCRLGLAMETSRAFIRADMQAFLWNGANSVFTRDRYAAKLMR